DFQDRDVQERAVSPLCATVPAVSAWPDALDSACFAADSLEDALASDVAALPSDVLALDADEAASPAAVTAPSRAAIDSALADKACVNSPLIWSIRSPMFADTRAQSDSNKLLLTIAHRP